ncbi:hypothetical protein HK101_002862 [Irineochytrium annulatum]|nr:hypothetical protein HK101_002862 [Irineochytrium annulatum]
MSRNSTSSRGSLNKKVAPEPDESRLGSPSAIVLPGIQITDEDEDEVQSPRSVRILANPSEREAEELHQFYVSLRTAAQSISDVSTIAGDAIAMKDRAIIINDPRADPRSDQFDHAFLLRGIRSFMKAHGMDYEEMPIAFRDLEVYGELVADTKIQTVGSTLRKVVNPLIQVVNYLKHLNHQVFPKKLKEPKQIIKGISGVMKPGECVLVIGRPGSGCSTFLRTLANRTTTFKEIRGQISYGGMTAAEVKSAYRAEVVYAEENDPHYPSLTVRQTLDFALQCRISNPSIRNGLLEVMLRLYGLSRCQNTVVGDENLRGVSGGEKKRVSLAESACVGGCAGVFDGCTKGLDAASALDFIQALRNSADFAGRTVIASCYQASDAMFGLFDRVVVLSDGHCAYFGPAADAVGYFEAMGFPKHPRDTICEYLTASVNARISPEDLATRYKASAYGVAMKAEAEEYLKPEKMKADKEAIAAAVVEKGKIMGHGKGPYAIYAYKQAWLLMKREAQIIRGNPSVVIIRYASAIIMSLIVGSVFFQLPTDTSGAFTRGGAIFFALLFNSVTALSELPKILDGRPVQYKHLDYALYRPSTYFITQIFFNLVLDIVQIVLFCTILYFMAGFQRDVGKYFFFLLCVIITGQTFSLIIKAVGNLSATKPSATQKAGALLMACVIYSGYIIPYIDMKPWFVWIFWMNPLAFGFKSLMINEFSGLAFTCATTNTVPVGPSYTNTAYQTCTLTGSQPGHPTVDGLDYLKASFSIDASFLWWNLVINAGIWCFMMLANAIIVEKIQHGKAGVSVKKFKEHRKGHGHGHDAEKGETGASGAVVATHAVYKGDPAEDAMKTLTWTDVVYKVPHPKERRKTLQLLDGVFGYARPGTMTALMGSSGAGKTTLLDVVAKRKTIGTIEGAICVGHKPQGADFFKFTGYCEQMDVLNQHSTVKEALRFAAHLRQPKSVPAEEKNAYCDHILSLLELEPLADALIGDLESGVGLSMEERKRLTIGIELVAKPHILFLDEPTSGLDSQASTNIVRILRNLAAEGHALLVTIHQPSAMLFSQFDRLLLLGRGGRMIYFGELGNDCGTMIKYFESNGAPACAPTANPAEYILDCIGAGTAKSANTIDWFERWKVSEECKQEQHVLTDLKQLAVEYAAAHADEVAKEDAKLLSDTPSLAEQVKTVQNRMFVSYWRSPDYNVGRVIFQIIAALIIGLTFFQAPATPNGAQNRVFALFMTSVIGVVVINLVQPVFMAQRNSANREVTSGAYRRLAYGVAITTVEMPFTIIASSVFFLMFYWTVGLNSTSMNVFYFYVMLVLFSLWAVSFGQMVASFSPSLQMASALVPLCTSILSLFCGVSVPYNSMPVFFRTWLYWIDPYHYFIEGLIVNDLHGLALTCDSRSFVNVTAPPTMTCAQYFKPFQSYAPGYLLESSNLTALGGYCQYCVVSVGDTFYSGLSWDYSDRWRNLAILAGYFIFNRIMTLVFISRHKEKR